MFCSYEALERIDVIFRTNMWVVYTTVLYFKQVFSVITTEIFSEARTVLVVSCQGELCLLYTTLLYMFYVMNLYYCYPLPNSRQKKYTLYIFLLYLRYTKSLLVYFWYSRNVPISKSIFHKLYLNCTSIIRYKIDIPNMYLYRVGRKKVVPILYLFDCAW